MKTYLFIYFSFLFNSIFSITEEECEAKWDYMSNCSIYLGIKSINDYFGICRKDCLKHKAECLEEAKKNAN